MANKHVLKVGASTLIQYSLETRHVKFEHGGWTGIVVFHDTDTNQHFVCVTTKLENYLAKISFDTVKKGRYGKGVQCSRYDALKVYYVEHTDGVDTLKVRQHKIKMLLEKKKQPTQLELGLKAKKKSGLVFGKNLNTNRTVKTSEKSDGVFHHQV